MSEIKMKKFVNGDVVRVRTTSCERRCPFIGKEGVVIVEGSPSRVKFDTPRRCDQFLGEGDKLVSDCSFFDEELRIVRESPTRNKKLTEWVK